MTLPAWYQAVADGAPTLRALFMNAWSAGPGLTGGGRRRERGRGCGRSRPAGGRGRPGGMGCPGRSVRLAGVVGVPPAPAHRRGRGGRVPERLAAAGRAAAGSPKPGRPARLAGHHHRPGVPAGDARRLAGAGRGSVRPGDPGPAPAGDADRVRAVADAVPAVAVAADGGSPGQLRADQRAAGHAHRRYRTQPGALPGQAPRLPGARRVLRARPRLWRGVGSMTGRWWDDDDELLAALRIALDEDNVPSRLVQQAKDVYLWRNVDDELAALTYDSSVDASPVVTRTEAAPLRTLIFATERLTIELEVTPEALFGQLIPPHSGEVELESATGTRRRATIDDLGVFLIHPIPPGSFRLCCRTAEDASAMTTWIVL